MIMSRHIIACAAAFAFAIGLSAQTPPAGGAQTPPGGGAQTPPAGRQTQPPPQTTGAAAAPGGSATIEGCLMKESDVRKGAAGGAGTVVEKATGTEDYILSAAKVLKGTAPASAASAGAPATPTGTSGAVTALMFDVRGLDQDKLKPFEGKRVEIDGTFADATRSATAGATQDLVD